jgi:hypothetical protein
MSENETPTNPRPRFEHIALSEASTLKINSWFEQINSKKKGVKISRKDFINWFIEKSPDALNSSDLSSVIDRFYDEAAFLRQLLRDVKLARSEGKNTTGFELVLKTKKTDGKREISDSTDEQSQKLESDI